MPELVCPSKNTQCSREEVLQKSSICSMCIGKGTQREQSNFDSFFFLSLYFHQLKHSAPRVVMDIVTSKWALRKELINLFLKVVVIVITQLGQVSDTWDWTETCFLSVHAYCHGVKCWYIAKSMMHCEQCTWELWKRLQGKGRGPFYHRCILFSGMCLIMLLCFLW